HSPRRSGGVGGGGGLRSNAGDARDDFFPKPRHPRWGRHYSRRSHCHVRIHIRGDRIAKAASIFPLTRRQDLNPSLGTRHRAAIGLSEETDAVVVVVSEETGAISYAYKGQLVRGLSLEHLRAFMTTVFVKDAKAQGMT